MLVVGEDCAEVQGNNHIMELIDELFETLDLLLLVWLDICLVLLFVHSDALVVKLYNLLENQLFFL